MIQLSPPIQHNAAPAKLGNLRQNTPKMALPNSLLFGAAAATPLPVSYSEASAKISPEFAPQFEKALNETPYPGILKKLAQKGWQFKIQPFNLETEQRAIAEITFQRGTKVILLRPATRGELYHFGAARDLSYALAKALNDGLLADAPQRGKLSDAKEFQAIVNPKVNRFLLPIREWVHQKIAKPILSDEAGFNPKGSDFFESAASSFLSGYGQKVLDEEKQKTEYQRKEFIAVYEYVGKLMEQFKQA